MEPTFHLEGVIRDKEEMQDFEGPLNVILMLLSKNKIEIRDIQISEILEQYLEYLAKMEELDLEIASEFVQMASHLLYIKTKTLLTGEKEISELEVLMSSLEQLRAKDLYAAVRAVTPELARASEQGMLLFSTPGEVLPKYGEYCYQHTGIELLQALSAMHRRALAPPESAPIITAIPQKIIYNVRDKSRQMITIMRKKRKVPLQDLYNMSGSRSELVATFISILELCALGNLHVVQDDAGVYMVQFCDGKNTEEILNSILSE